MDRFLCQLLFDPSIDTRFPVFGTKQINVKRSSDSELVPLSYFMLYCDMMSDALPLALSLNLHLARAWYSDAEYFKGLANILGEEMPMN